MWFTKLAPLRSLGTMEKLSILKDGVNNDKRQRYTLSKFFSPQETGAIMKAASIVVSRSGINTVSELIVLQKPALLIPIPKTSANEQVENAMFFEKIKGLEKWWNRKI